VVGCIPVRVADFILAQAGGSTADRVEDFTLAPEAVCIQGQEAGSIPVPEADFTQDRAGESMKGRLTPTIRRLTRVLGALVLPEPLETTGLSKTVLNELAAMITESRFLTEGDMKEVEGFIGHHLRMFTPKLPDGLFHYTTGETLIKILSSHNLWATHTACLNDSSEFTYAVATENPDRDETA